jgi:hypothetical protein
MIAAVLPASNMVSLGSTYRDAAEKAREILKPIVLVRVQEVYLCNLLVNIKSRERGLLQDQVPLPATPRTCRNASR